MLYRCLTVLLGCLLLLACTSRATATPPDQTCADATKRVQEYKAPGQRITVLEAITLNLAAERRPVQVNGWGPAEWAGRGCLVSFHATIGNERQGYYWSFTPATGKVEARDDATKRLSGW
jgi:hypothetical protein